MITCNIRCQIRKKDLHKVLGDFGAKYAKDKPTKDHGNHPISRKTFNRPQENNNIVNNVVDVIILNET